MIKIQIGVDQNLEISIRIEVNLDLANRYNVGTVAKLATLRGIAKVLRRRMMMILLMLEIDEVQDALLLAVDSPLDDWVLDSGASFHTTPH